MQTRIGLGLFLRPGRNAPPALAMPLPGLDVTVGAAQSLDLSGHFADPGDVLTFTATGLPAGLSLSPGGRVTGAAAALGGPATVSVTATDTAGQAVTAETEVSVVANAAPILLGAIPAQAITAGVPVNLDLSGHFYDPGDTLAFSAADLPAGLSLSPAGVLSGTAAASGTAAVTVTATDSAAQAVSAVVTVEIAAGNAAPQVVAPIPDQSFTAGVALSLDVSGHFSDPGDALAFAAAGLPAGLAISAAGVIAGTPAAPSAPGEVTVTATDTAGQQAAAAFTAEVAAAAVAPSISGAPTISGAESEGATLLAAAAPATGEPAPVTGWQWRRDGSAIPGATGASHVLGAADVGATLTVVQTETNSAGTASAESAATGVIAGQAAVLTAVAADGWRATHPSPPATFDPEDAPVVVPVTRAGFDASGAPVAVADALTVMARVRVPYPDHATLTPETVALSDFVYAPDTVAGATNGSTRAYPQPIAMWLHPDRARATGGSFTARLAVAHWHARAGRPVAAVRFTISDGTATVSQTVSAMSTVSYAASGRTVPHFAATLDLSGLAPDALLTLDATIYPWVGEAFTASVDGSADPAIGFGALRVLNDVGYGTAYAYVDAAAGDDGAGVASADAGAAAAAPFASVPAAAAAIRDVNAASFGRSDASGGVIRLVAGVHAHASFSAVAVGEIPLEIEAADPAARASTIYRDAGASVSNGCPDRVLFRNLTLARNTSSSVIFLDSGAGAGSGNMMAFEDCSFDDAGHGGFWGAWLYKPGRVWMTGCEAGAAGLTDRFSSANKQVNLIGCSGALVGLTVYNMAGCATTGANHEDSALGFGDRPLPEGQFFGFNTLSLGAGSGSNLEFVGAVGPRGLAIVGNVIEDVDGGSNGTLLVSADSITAPADNVVIQLNTVVGQRTNILYNDAGGAGIAKHGQARFNAFRNYNCKNDVFEQDGAYTGNWSVSYKVGFRANAYLQGDSSGDAAPGAGVWLGEVLALGDVSGGPGAPLAAGWADDASADGSGAGGGDYTPGAGAALPAIPAGLAPYPADQLGRPVPDDGTGVAGALQRG